MIALITHNRRTQRAELHIQRHIVLEMCHIIIADLIQLISKQGPVGSHFPSAFFSLIISWFLCLFGFFGFCFLCSIIFPVYFSKVE